VEASTVELNNMLLVAPFDGVVGKSLVSPGDYVTVGQALVSLTDTKHLRVEYTVAEKYFALLKLGQEVHVTSSALPGKEFTGKVAYVAPTLNVENRTVSVYAEVPNDNQVMSPGLFVNVTQSLGSREHALLVNAMSLVGTIDGEQVFSMKNGKAVATPVEVGQRMLDNVEILKGIDEGDSVIVAGQQKIRDGEDVVVKAG
jgi:membrane fusion protein (multidrug efflux system)